MIEEISTLIRKEKRQQLMDLLISLDAKQKKELVPGIKKLNKELSEWKADRSGNFKRTGTDTQVDLTLLSSFACMRLADYEKVFSPFWFLQNKRAEKILDWYCPDWMSDFLNKTAETDFAPFFLTYELLMKLHQNGYIQPSPALLANHLVNAIFRREGNVDIYQPEALEVHPQTLQEHIWYLFEHETNLHYSNRWMRFQEGLSKERTDWISCFNTLIYEGKLDRQRVLREALLASNKNFNKVLSGFFSELLQSLDPTKDEIMVLQKEIFSSLSAPHSKPVNTGLQLIKKIVGEKDFDAQGFLDYVPVLLTSPTKAVVASAMMILEKLGKKRKELQAGICEQVLPAFINSDNDVQTRAAKLIVGFEAALAPGFADQLLAYESTVMRDAKQLLMPLLPQSSSGSDIGEETMPTAAGAVEEAQPIPYPGSFDDFVFFASQAFDNHQSWHMDVLINELLLRWPSLAKDGIDKLEPALQRALQLTRSQLRAGQGSLDHMLAIFFIDVCVLLVRKYPDRSAQLQQLFAQFDQKTESATRRWLSISDNSWYMQGWAGQTEDPFYEPYRLMLIAVLEKLKEDAPTPLLSTPTHEPGWIDASVLVRRLAAYQQTGTAPHDIDCQVAVSRCILQEPEAAIKLAMELIEGEYQHIILYLLGAHDEPRGPFTAESIWVCAAVAKRAQQLPAAFQSFYAAQKPFAHFNGQYPWKVLIESYQAERHEWKNGSFHKHWETAYRKMLQINMNLPAPVAEAKGLKKLVQSFLGKPKPTVPFKAIYEFMQIKATWFWSDSDMRRILLLSPNNPEKMTSSIIHKCLASPQLDSEPVKRGLIASLQTLLEIGRPMGEMAQLITASCLLSADKTVLNLAGEIWLQGVSRNTIDSAFVGTCMGKLQAIEFAPLKRFTDHAMLVLFRVSALHNRQLQVLVEAQLAELPDTPIKNLKKLLELYVELLSANNSVPAELVKPKLAAWRDHAGLKGLVGKM